MLEVGRIVRDHCWETDAAVASEMDVPGVRAAFRRARALPAQGPDLGVSSGGSACSEQKYRGSVKDREELENESVRRFPQHRATP
jgi:hypothetical protein